MQPAVLFAADALILGAYLLVLGLLGVYGLHRWHLLWLARRHGNTPDPSPAAPSPLPRVTVQLPIYNERLVAGRLIRAVCRLDYPAERLEIQVLDDSTDDTSRRLSRLVRRARRLGIDIHHLRRRRRSGFKAGALAAGLAVARGEFIAIFDADFVPPRDFLRRTLPPFRHPRVGMVQARWGHLNRRTSLLTRVQAVLLDGHFLVEHLARNRSGRFFNFNGTAGVWRRACIEDAGGWQHETLTEDLDLSYRAQLRGWSFVFLPGVVAPAELPGRMAAFKSQQHRWAKGSIETARKLLGKILRSRLPWRVRVEAVFHLTENFAYVLMVLLCLLLWPSIRVRARMQATPLLFVDLLILAGASLSVAVFYVCSQRRAGRTWLESVAAIPILMGVGVGLAVNNARAVLEALVGHRSPFVRTPKDAATEVRPASRRPYRRRAGVLPLVEAGFALYLTAALVDALAGRLWPWAPFLVVFIWGFAFNAALGLREWRSRSAHPPPA